MELEWDYGTVAADYDARPAYADAALAACCDGIDPGMRACDVGAGTGRFALALAARGFAVVAVEPSAAMRARGITNAGAAVRGGWVAGRAEALPIRDASCGLAAFGSSFNVVDRGAALVEAARILVPGGRLACVWNHRELDDPLQRRIEDCIRRHVPAYAHGTRRESQRAVIEASGLFRHVRRCDAARTHRVRVRDWMAAWRSHLTLRRQAGERFEAVLGAIADVVAAGTGDVIAVPYVTRAWLAERR